MPDNETRSPPDRAMLAVHLTFRSRSAGVLPSQFRLAMSFRRLRALSVPGLLTAAPSLSPSPLLSYQLTHGGKAAHEPPSEPINTAFPAFPAFPVCSAILLFLLSPQECELLWAPSEFNTFDEQAGDGVMMFPPEARHPASRTRIEY
jgi:hypothetical protein